MDNEKYNSAHVEGSDIKGEEGFYKLAASLVTTHQLFIDDWDLNWNSGAMSASNRKKIIEVINRHNDSLKTICIGLKAAYELKTK